MDNHGTENRSFAYPRRSDILVISPEISRVAVVRALDMF